jgi:TPR repeat protein
MNDLATNPLLDDDMFSTLPELIKRIYVHTNPQPVMEQNQVEEQTGEIQQDKKQTVKAERTKKQPIEIEKEEETAPVPEAKTGPKSSEEEIEEAFRMARKAAENDNFALAAEAFLPLAKAGHAEAQYNRAQMLLAEKHEPNNVVEAIKWFRLAAEGGYEGAELMLGHIYTGSFGYSEPDIEVGIKWYERYAQQTLDTAIFNTLGTLCEESQSGGNYQLRALMFYYLAEWNGNSRATQDLIRLRDEIGPEKDVAARTMARNWEKNRERG